MLAGVTAVRGQALPAEPRSVAAREPEAYALGGVQLDLGRLEIIRVSDVPFDRSLRLTTTATPSAEGNLQLFCPTNARVKAGDVLLACFWFRCHDSMSGEGYVTFAFEPGKQDEGAAAEFRTGAASEWRHVSVPFRAPRDYAAGEARVCFRLGFDRQVIDLGGIEVLNYGGAASLDGLPRTTITYVGRQPGAPWRQEALQRIERHRKGELTVRVTDAAGRPVPGARVRMTLRRHAFGFGSAVTVAHLLGQTEDARRYRDFVERHFNTAVFENDMKWQDNYESHKPGVDEALDWLLQRGIRVRGHNLLWPSWRWLPQRLQQHRSSPAELRFRTCQRVTQTVHHYRGRLVHWDVVNEPYSERDLMDILGNDVMLDWFRLAKQADPECQLYLNDYGIFDGGTDNPHRKHFFETIRWLLEEGAPIDGIGIQSHFSAMPAPPTRLLSVLDQFATLGLPIESTELSLNMPDRQLQADYMRDYLTALFSHPRVNGVMLWGFWEGRHWRPDAALFDRDWTPRPVADAWTDLVHREWKTNVTVVADEQGVARTRGFRGDYELLVSDGPTFTTSGATLDGDGAEVTVIVDRFSPR